MKKLTLKLLGSVQILLDGEPLNSLLSVKSQALLISLAVTGQPFSRNALAGLLWPESSHVDAKTNLRQVLSKTRRLLPDHLIVSRHQVSLTQSANLFVDVIEFESLLQKANRLLAGGEAGAVQSLRQAVELYQGDFLAGFSTADADPFEEWYLSEQERLRNLMVNALNQIARHHSLRRQIGPGLRYTGRLLQMDPWREEHHQQMMRLLAWDGQITAALSHYHTCREMLQRELGVDPLPQTTALYERVLALRQGVRHNLPLVQTPFVGRQEELAALADWLHDPDCRLVTITGSGGMGKTSLALEAARRHLPLFLDGVYFMDLAGLDQREQVVTALAAAVGYSFSGSQPPERQLISYLQNWEALLLLDNFEHLLGTSRSAPALDLLAALLARIPDVKFLVTSRHRLNLVEEWVFALGGLPYPVEEAGAEGYESVRLFAQSAQRSHRHFCLEDELGAVVEICRLLEGLPLAIDLAAGLLPGRSCSQIAADLAQSLEPLTTPAYNRPPRQQSIQAAFTYSWRLLGEEERDCLVRLSPCRGGFTQQAAAVIAGATPAQLASLVNHSWLQKRGDRYHLHELVRRFVAEQSTQRADQALLLQRRHCEYYMALAARHGQEVDGPEMIGAVATIQADLANIRHAWQWAVAQGHLPALAQGIDGLTHFYLATNQFAEGEEMMGMAVHAFQAELTQRPARRAEVQPLLTRAVTSLARQFMVHRRFDEATAAIQQGLAWAAQSEDSRLLIQNLLCWGGVLYQQGAYAEAQEKTNQGIRLAQQARLADLEAVGWQYVGSIHYYLSEYPQARDAYKRALAYYAGHAPRFPRQRSGLLNNIGNVYLRQGHFAQAETRYRQSLALRRQGENTQIGGIVAINNLGLVALGKHCYSDALDHFQHALRLYQRADLRSGVSMVLGNLGDLYRQVGKYEQALQAAQEDLAIIEEIGRRSRRAMRLVRLGAIYHDMGEMAQALEYGQRAVEMASDRGEKDIWGDALALLGRIHQTMGNPEEAHARFRQAFDLRSAIGQVHLALESWAGMTDACLAVGRNHEAQELVEQILSALDRERQVGMNLPIPTYLTVARVLAANQDERARDILTTAHRLLHQRAAQIRDEEMRASYLRAMGDR